MSVRLLLLLALVGPFCAFTHASPTELPGDQTSSFPQTDQPVSTQAATEGFSTAASLPPTTAAATAAATEEATEAATATEADAVPEVTTVPLTQTNTPDVTAAVTDLTSEPITPAAETEGPTELVGTVQTAVVKGDQAEVGEEMVVEDKAVEGLGSGQVVGIVIGALVAAAVVIAVVIVVMRRMGKYSSAKNKRRTTKDSVMVSPLRKKTTKQDHPKFWKF